MPETFVQNISTALQHPIFSILLWVQMALIHTVRGAKGMRDTLQANMA